MQQEDGAASHPAIPVVDLVPAFNQMVGEQGIAGVDAAGERRFKTCARDRLVRLGDVAEPPASSRIDDALPLVQQAHHLALGKQEGVYVAQVRILLDAVLGSRREEDVLEVQQPKRFVVDTGPKKIGGDPGQ